MKKKIWGTLIVCTLLGGYLVSFTSISAKDTTKVVKASNEIKARETSIADPITSESTPTIAPVIVGHEDETDVVVNTDMFEMTVTGNSLNEEYRYQLPKDIEVITLTDRVNYDKNNNEIVFPKMIPFNSNIKFKSANGNQTTYTFDFSFSNQVSTVITSVTTNNEKQSSNSSGSSDFESQNRNPSVEILDNESPNVKREDTKELETYEADNPQVLGGIKEAPKSMDLDEGRELSSEYNFTPKIYPGITKVGYNTTNATQDINVYDLTGEEMLKLKTEGNYYVYYKRAGIYKGRYIDIKWMFHRSPNVDTNVRLRLNRSLDSNYPNDRLMTMTNVAPFSRINTEMSFIDSQTGENSIISGYLSYGNVDNAEYYTFNEEYVENYIYSYEANELLYVSASPDTPEGQTDRGIQGKPQGTGYIDKRNSFTVLFDSKTSFPVTYGHGKGSVGDQVWLGALDLHLLYLGYSAPLLFGDEFESNTEDNLLEYRVVQSNPSRGGGQTQIVLPEEYKIRVEIPDYELLNPIKAENIVVNRLDTKTNITDNFNILIDDKGKIEFTLKDVSKESIQKQNFPSTMEILFKTTPKENSDLTDTFRVIDGQGYYVFPITGELLYKQPAVDDKIILKGNTAEAKIKTDDLPITQKSYANITKQDGLNREGNKLFIGDVLKYEVKIKNNSQRVMKDITLIDQLPDKTLFRKLDDYILTIGSQEISLTESLYDEEKNQLKVLLEEIPANSEVSLKYELQVTGRAQEQKLLNKASLVLSNGAILETEISTEKVSKIPILNPEKPTEVITPETGTYGPQLNNLNLVYVPSFDFGKQKITNKDREYNANLLKTTDGKGVPHFVQLHDTMQEQSGWKLSMTLSDFYDSKKTNTLAGTQLILRNAQYNTFEGLKQPFEGKLPQDIRLTAGGDANILAQSTSTEDTQNTIISFGNTIDNTAASSVKLNVPGQVKKIADTYQASLDWQLQDVPE